MNPRRIAPLLIALVLVALFALWRGLEPADLPTRPVSAASTATAERADGTTPEASNASPALAAPVAEDLKARQLGSVRSEQAQQAAAVVLQSFALDRAVWIEGTIIIPSGTPRDEMLEVIALANLMLPPSDMLDREHFPAAIAAKVNTNRPWSRSRVSDTGAFRLPIPKVCNGASIFLDGRYVYLDEPLKLANAEPRADVVLRPALGVWIVARCMTPTNAKPENTPIGADYELRNVEDQHSDPVDAEGITRSGKVDSNSGFELRGLPAEHAYRIDVDPVRLVAQRKQVPRSAAGAKIELTFELELGASIAGKVIDEAGQGVSKAYVFAELARDEGARYPYSVPSTSSASDGSFEFLALPEGKVRLSVDCEGYVRARTSELVLVDASVRDDVVVTLTRGNVISGRVTWPDGAPADQADVRLVWNKQWDEERAFGEAPLLERDTKTDADGRFTISGLSTDAFNVSAWTTRALETPTLPSTPSTAQVDDRAAQDRSVFGSRRQSLPLWTASRDDVPAGTTHLALELQMPAGLRGRVVDHAGMPLEAFSVQTFVPPTADADTSLLAMRRAQEFQTPDGSFVCPTVPAGQWSIKVKAKGYVQAGERPVVEVPQAGPELVIELSKAARIIGRVLDPAGKPVAKARIAADLDADVAFSSSYASTSTGEAIAESPLSTTTADAQGGFVLERLPRGTLFVAAKHADWAKSEALLVALDPGEELTDVVLELRAGGSVAGVALERDGNPIARGRVQLWSNAHSDARSSRLDARGQFLIDRVAPGAYRLSLVRMRSMFETDAGEDDQDGVDFDDDERFVTIAVRNGETTHVTLGGPPVSPVRVFGRVTDRGKPVAGRVYPARRASTADAKPVDVGATGEYELVVDGAGPLTLTFVTEHGMTERVPFSTAVPAVAEFRFDLELPHGAVRGCVRGLDGKPLSKAIVEMQFDPAGDGWRATAVTNANGRYAFSKLQPGSYSVGMRNHEFDTVREKYGRALRGGLHLAADAVLDDIDLQLSPPVSVNGIVRDLNGNPLGGASIFVRSREGTLVDSFSRTMSDAAGRFTFSGLAAGRYTFSARHETLAAPDSAPVSVDPGSSAHVELKAQAGTVLHLALDDAHGSALAANFRVRDGQDFEVSALFSSDDAFRNGLITDRFSIEEQRIGPLPPGNYRVTARTLDGRESSQSVTLDGAPTLTLKLRL